MHSEYRAAFDEIVVGYGVDAVIVSSLIGHSMEVLETGLPTVVVNHDYFPYCPSINLYFDAVCASCDGHRIAQCERENDHFNPFVGFPPDERESVRRRFLDLVRLPNVIMATPSDSVAANLLALEPAFARARFVTVPYGYGSALLRLPAPPPGPERLRVLVLGQMSMAKGVEILREALPRLVDFADVYVLGAKELGEFFRYEPHVHVTSYYDIRELPRHVANINPHVGVLASIVPETFSYALSELQMLGVPVAATRSEASPSASATARRATCSSPTPSACGAGAAIDSNRTTLQAVRSPRRVEAAYRRGNGRRLPAAAARARCGRPCVVGRASITVRPQLGRALSMWKEVKRLHLELSVVHEARNRDRRRTTGSSIPQPGLELQSRVDASPR